MRLRDATAKDLRALIGKTLYWDDISPRYIFLHNGVLTGVEGKRIDFDDAQNWRLRTRYVNLRTTKELEG